MMINRLNALKAELAHHAELNDVSFEVGEPEDFEAKNPWFKSVQKGIGKDIKDTFESVLREFDRLAVSALDSEERIIHEVNFDGTLYAFNSFAQTEFIHAYESFGQTFIDFARQFYPIDIYYKAYDEMPLTCVKPQSEGDPAEFWFWHNAGHKYKLQFSTFEEYINAGIDCKFIVNWQYFYVDAIAMDFKDPFTKEWLAPNFSEAIRKMKDVLEKMHQYYPTTDWSGQEAALKRIQEK